MLFNSTGFAVFLPVVFCLYWLLGKRLKLQNILLLIASYYFYATWDSRFLLLLIFSTLLDFFSGIKIHEAESSTKRKTWLCISVAANLGFLGFFKYYNFFVESFAALLTSIGLQVNPWTLNIVLPVGISFYTFHGLSYVFDIYNRKIEPVRNIVDYSVFVSFFPLLVAGPIERATHLLPQIQTARQFEYSKAVDGLRQILWGLFKKLVIADNCAVYADLAFDQYQTHSGSSLLIGAIFFSFQIYGDFSGYSDIALGSARLFGIELLQNFSFPYFSRDIPEFWRRWHISLTTWFRDYLYLPLGGSRGTRSTKVRNTAIIFLVSGFWHGANWTFVFWGALNALYFLPYQLANRNRQYLDVVAKGRVIPTWRDLWQMLITFSLTTFAWIFFRAESLSAAFGFVARMFRDLFSFPGLPKRSLMVLVLVSIMLAFEWNGRERRHGLERVAWQHPRPVRWLIYLFIIFLIGMFMQTSQTPFIYFQF